MSIVNAPLNEIETPFQFRDKNSEALSKESIKQLAEEMKVNGVWDLAIPARKRDGVYEAALFRGRKMALPTMRFVCEAWVP